MAENFTPQQPKEIDVFNRYSKFNKIKSFVLWLYIAVVLCTGVYFLAKIFTPYTISIETYGGTIFGERVEDRSYRFLERSEEPKNIKKEGYYIAGYYTDKNLKNEFEFGKRVWNSKKLYIDWQPGYALQLYLAEGEDTAERSEHDKTGITQDYIKLYYEQYVAPNSSYQLPLIYNNIEGNEHYGEQLLWYLNEEAEGMPFDSDLFVVDKNIKLYGRWFDTSLDKFDISSEGVLNRYLGECANIQLPSTVRKIKDINHSEFQSGRWNTTNVADGSKYSAFDKVFEKLSRVIINSQCTEIGDCAFRNCNSLQSVLFKGNTLTSVGAWSFFECSSLETLELPTTTTTIKDRAFYRSGLKNLSGTSGITTIGNSAFVECLGMKEIEFSNVTTIGNRAFAGCSSLEKVILRMNYIPQTNVTGYEDNLLYLSTRAKIYVPEDTTFNKCYVVQSEGVIRGYDHSPSYNTSYSYRDYYVNSDYIYREGSGQWNNYSTLPTCLDSGIITNEFYYRVDMYKILIMFVIFAFFGLYIPIKIFSKLFRKGGL